MLHLPFGDDGEDENDPEVARDRSFLIGPSISVIDAIIVLESKSYIDTAPDAVPIDRYLRFLLVAPSSSLDEMLLRQVIGSAGRVTCMLKIDSQAFNGDTSSQQQYTSR